MIRVTKHVPVTCPTLERVAEYSYSSHFIRDNDIFIPNCSYLKNLIGITIIGMHAFSFL